MNIWRNISEEDLEGEKWMWITAAPDYQVSSLGRVRVMINRDNRNGRNFWVGKIITQNPANKTQKYLRANLRTCGGLICFSAHRLVALEFVKGKTEERDQVNHKDGNPENNHFSNLEWVTVQENKDHAIATGLQWYLEGEDRIEAKLSKSDVLSILDRYFYRFETSRTIGSDFGMEPEYISLIIRGKRWASVFKEWLTVNNQHYTKVQPILVERNGNNGHLIIKRLTEAVI